MALDLQNITMMVVCIFPFLYKDHADRAELRATTEMRIYSIKSKTQFVYSVVLYKIHNEIHYSMRYTTQSQPNGSIICRPENIVDVQTIEPHGQAFHRP